MKDYFDNKKLLERSEKWLKGRAELIYNLKRIDMSLGSSIDKSNKIAANLLDLRERIFELKRKLARVQEEFNSRVPLHTVPQVLTPPAYIVYLTLLLACLATLLCAAYSLW